MKKLVIFARPFDLSKIQLAKLKKHFNLFFYKEKIRPTSEKIVKFASDADAIIAGGEIYNSKVLEKLKKLKIISRVGIGTDNIDLKVAKKKKITIKNTPDAPSKSTAEFTFSLIISAVKKINLLNFYVKKKQWKRILHNEFSELTIGIIGCGRIGSRLIKLLKSVGFKLVLVNEIDKSKKLKFNKNHSVKFVSKDYLYQNSDIITLHIPHNKKTDKLINEKSMKKFKKNMILINASRGGIVCIKALEKYIKLKKIGCAMLDVMPNEPYFGKLINFKEIIITPHNASMSYSSRKKMQEGSLKNLLNWVRTK